MVRDSNQRIRYTFVYAYCYFCFYFYYMHILKKTKREKPALVNISKSGYFKVTHQQSFNFPECNMCEDAVTLFLNML